MSVVIVGYGKIGKIVEEEAIRLKIPISKIITSRNSLLNYNFTKNEVCIEFTEPSSCLENIQIIASRGINTVCGTTGWNTKVDKVKKIIEQSNTGFIYASNFSIGVNIFWKIIKKASSLIDKFEDYDVMGHEVHHNTKKDFPSGTALTTAEIILEHIKRKKRVLVQNIDRVMHPDEFSFSSSRCGSIIGNHEVVFDSTVDSIKISHHSKVRNAHAKGALNCAQWIRDKKGFYTIEDYIKELLYA